MSDELGPLQTVLLLEMMLWTLTVTDSLLAVQRGDREALLRAHQSIQEDIQSLVTMAVGSPEEATVLINDLGSPSGRKSGRPSQMVEYDPGRKLSHMFATAEAHRRSSITQPPPPLVEHSSDEHVAAAAADDAIAIFTEERLRRGHLLAALSLAIVNRDRTLEMIEKGTDSPNDFLWVQYPRYYYDVDLRGTVVMIGDTRIPYTFEYDGGLLEDSLMPTLVSTTVPQVISMAASLQFTPCHALRPSHGSLSNHYAVKTLSQALGQLLHV